MERIEISKLISLWSSIRLECPRCSFVCLVDNKKQSVKCQRCGIDIYTTGKTKEFIPDPEYINELVKFIDDDLIYIRIYSLIEKLKNMNEKDYDKNYEIILDKINNIILDRRKNKE